MRKNRLLLLLALLLTAATGAWAQQTLTVYDGTSEENTSPAYIAFIDEYTRSQTVIPSTALTAMKGCDITAMTFYSATVISFTTECSFDVYLKEVSYSAFAESPTFEPKSSCTTVYQGTLSVVNGTLTLTVTFSKPFHYNGGNLLIGAENTSKGNYYQISFLGRDTGSSLSNICIHDSNDLASAPIKTRKFIPKTTFAYVDPTYTVKLADGTQDAKNWTITSGEKSVKGDAADGLTGLSEKDAVTLQYTGRLKVKGVKATSDEPAKPAAEGHALSASVVGEIVGTDGKAYAAADKDNLPKGVKAEALVCYVDGEHGLALAMADVKDAKMSWDNNRGANDGKTAAEWCTGWNTSHPITGATWLLASKTQWNNMISAAGSASNLSNAFSAVGGTNLQAFSYWSSTPNIGTSAWRYYFPSSSWSWTYLNQDNTGSFIRACLEW